MMLFGIFRDGKCIEQVKHPTYRNVYSLAFSRMCQLTGLPEDDFKSKILIMQGRSDRILAKIQVSGSVFEIKDLND